MAAAGEMRDLDELLVRRDPARLGFAELGFHLGDLVGPTPPPPVLPSGLRTGG